MVNLEQREKILAYGFTCSQKKNKMGVLSEKYTAITEEGFLLRKRVLNSA
jgi:hypothetical protein